MMEAQGGGEWKSSISGATGRIDPSAVFSTAKQNKILVNSELNRLELGNVRHLSLRWLGITSARES